MSSRVLLGNIRRRITLQQQHANYAERATSPVAVAVVVVVVVVVDVVVFCAVVVVVCVLVVVCMVVVIVEIVMVFYATWSDRGRCTPCPNRARSAANTRKTSAGRWEWRCACAWTCEWW